MNIGWPSVVLASKYKVMIATPVNSTKNNTFTLQQNILLHLLQAPFLVLLHLRLFFGILDMLTVRSKMPKIDGINNKNITKT